MSSTLIGQGNIGKAYLVEDGSSAYVKKVFAGESSPLVKLVNILSSGAPNPYIWNEDAVQTAHVRRNVLASLMEYWFGGEVSVARSLGHGWNQEHMCYEMDTEYVDFRHARLNDVHHRSEEIPQLEEILVRLQKNLIESGIFGAVWQAGKGIPLAYDDFVIRNDAGPGKKEWVALDFEAAIPALLPINPLALLTYYIPKSFHFKRPLFDDVDTELLDEYIESHIEDIETKIGKGKAEQLLLDASSLRTSQERWKSMGFRERSIQYLLKKGDISEEEADVLSGSPLRWFAKMSWEAGSASYQHMRKSAAKFVNKVVSTDYIQAAKKFWKFVSSTDYRVELANDYIEGRIKESLGRGNLGQEEAAGLRRELADSDLSENLAGFEFHTGIKPIENIIRLALLPVSAYLYSEGVIEGSTATLLATAAIFSGSIMRSAYSIQRMARDYASSYDGRVFNSLLNRPHAIALGIGLIPAIGGFIAYPAELLYNSSEKELPRFVLFDTITRFGEKLPIWGGKDTGSEHFFNNVAYRILGDRNLPKV